MHLNRSFCLFLSVALFSGCASKPLTGVTHPAVRTAGVSTTVKMPETATFSSTSNTAVVGAAAAGGGIIGATVASLIVAGQNDRAQDRWGSVTSVGWNELQTISTNAFAQEMQAAGLGSPKFGTKRQGEYRVEVTEFGLSEAGLFGAKGRWPIVGLSVELLDASGEEIWSASARAVSSHPISDSNPSMASAAFQNATLRAAAKIVRGSKAEPAVDHLTTFRKEEKGWEERTFQ